MMNKRIYFDEGNYIKVNRIYFLFNFILKIFGKKLALIGNIYTGKVEKIYIIYCE